MLDPKAYFAQWQAATQAVGPSTLPDFVVSAGLSAPQAAAAAPQSLPWLRKSQKRPFSTLCKPCGDFGGQALMMLNTMQSFTRHPVSSCMASCRMAHIFLLLAGGVSFRCAVCSSRQGLRLQSRGLEHLNKSLTGQQRRRGKTLRHWSPSRRCNVRCKVMGFAQIAMGRPCARWPQRAPTSLERICSSSHTSGA